MKRTVAKIITSSSFAAILAFALPACTLLGDDVILIEDFETPTYGQWTVEGDAFGKGGNVKISSLRIRELK